ncbi:UNVERIFIED_CONTAM: hypothetical protein HDU68_010690 [Siphonaria sp. JEL0065]|nr:hypothetical protein HDU68_010690 [Siphonaria sp. JEL0065]
MTQVVTNSKQVNTDNKVYSVIKFREELRLLCVSIGMLAVTVVSLHHAFNPDLPFLNIWSIVFVFTQVILVMGSQKVIVGESTNATQKSKSHESGVGNKTVGSNFSNLAAATSSRGTTANAVTTNH